MSVVCGTFWDEPLQTFCVVSIPKLWIRNCLSVLSRIQRFEEPHQSGGWRDQFTSECSLNVQGALGSSRAMCWVLGFAWRQLQAGSTDLGPEKNRFLGCVASHVWLFKNGMWDPKTKYKQWHYTENKLIASTVEEGCETGVGRKSLFFLACINSCPTTLPPTEIMCLMGKFSMWMSMILQWYWVSLSFVTVHFTLFW